MTRLINEPAHHHHCALRISPRRDGVGGVVDDAKPVDAQHPVVAVDDLPNVH